MDVDEVGTKLLEVGKLHRLVVDKGATLATWRDGATDDGVVVVVDVQLGKDLFEAEVGDIELSLHYAGTRAILYGCAVVLGSEQQRQCTHQNRLSGSRLTRDDVERGVELDFEVLDECVVLYKKSA